jgi:hypothetical protein
VSVSSENRGTATGGEYRAVQQRARSRAKTAHNEGDLHMRRLLAVLAVTAVATAFAAGGVASAHTSGTRSEASCASVFKKYQKSSAAASKINISNPQSLSAAFKAAAKTFRSLAYSGPSKLRPAFKALANLYAHLTGVNFSDPSSLSQLEAIGTTDGKYLTQIAQYFAKTCGFTVPTSPSAGAGISTP